VAKAQHKAGNTGNTAFGPPRSEKYSQMVHFGTMADARASVEKLRDEFKNANTEAKKLHVARVVNLAANRAEIMTHEARLSPSVREEKKPIEQLFRSTAEQMFKDIKNGDPPTRLQRQTANEAFLVDARKDLQAIDTRIYENLSQARDQLSRAKTEKERRTILDAMAKLENEQTEARKVVKKLEGEVQAEGALRSPAIRQELAKDRAEENRAKKLVMQSAGIASTGRKQAREINVIDKGIDSERDAIRYYQHAEKEVPEHAPELHKNENQEHEHLHELEGIHKDIMTPRRQTIRGG
jgi:hypothetical protein